LKITLQQAAGNALAIAVQFNKPKNPAIVKRPGFLSFILNRRTEEQGTSNIEVERSIYSFY
jgi:hypothetical protein